MSAAPLVSFCMSTYKRPALLEEQLKCILRQEYRNFEVVVSDNDVDRSAQRIVEAMGDPRIKYFPNAENFGMIRSFNKSIERSSGEYIVMITDDDPTYNHMLKDLVDLQNKYPDYGVYSGCGDWIIENEYAARTLDVKLGKLTIPLKAVAVNEIRQISAENFAESYLDGFFSSTFLLWSCMMVRREILLDIEGVPTYGSELLGDHAYVIATGSEKGMVYINKPMGAQVAHGQNFGYDIFKLKEKYINTPQWFFMYLKSQLERKQNWKAIEKKIWNFAGRSWVEYSLQIKRSLKNKDENIAFSKLFDLAFKRPEIKKWKYKYYLKFYFRPLFNLLLKFKK